MSILSFFLVVLATCFFWTAACTAAAVRIRQPWLRRLVLVVGLLAPMLSLLPFVAMATVLEFIAHLEVSWFSSILTLFIAVVIGCGWILRSGTQPHGGGWSTVPAAKWSVIGLFTLFVLSKSVAAGVILFMNQAAITEAEFLQLESASLMTTHLPPVVSDADNAAELYRAAAQLIEDDKDFVSAPLDDPKDPAVIAILERHAPTLDILRRATARPTCRFTRDYSRPSMDMVLPEIQFLRTAARLFAVSARISAAQGKADQALSDIVCISRMSQHASSEPLLISGLVGISIDSIAIDSLIAVLPTLKKQDLGLLKEDDLQDFLRTPLSLQRNLYGEEAFGLSIFSQFGSGQLNAGELAFVLSHEASIPETFSQSTAFLSPTIMAYRIFLFHFDLAAYKNYLHTLQNIAAQQGPYARKKTVLEKIEKDLGVHRYGILTSLIAPAVGKAIERLARATMRHQAALVAVAATCERLTNDTLPEKSDDLVPEQLPCIPRDAFDPEHTLIYSLRPPGAAIYSVGPNGKDDGGPTRPNDKTQKKTDDVGVFLLIQPSLPADE